MSLGSFPQYSVHHTGKYRRGNQLNIEPVNSLRWDQLDVIPVEHAWKEGVWIISSPHQSGGIMRLSPHTSPPHKVLHEKVRFWGEGGMARPNTAKSSRRRSNSNSGVHSWVIRPGFLCKMYNVQPGPDVTDSLLSMFWLRNKLVRIESKRLPWEFTYCLPLH